MTTATPDGQTELGGDDAAQMTEILDLDVAKMSAVSAAANGTKFLVMKAKAEGRGLFDADGVRALAKESTVTDTPDAVVTKADGDTAEVSDLDPNTLLAEPPEAAPGGGESVPGSKGWESIDSATASKWAEILARAVAAITLLAERERVEFATGAEDNTDDAWNLEDAADAAEFAMGALASFALSENLEAMTEAGDLETVMKAVTGAEAPLRYIETLVPVLKAGRTLSAANETAIRTAIASLTNVINTLPAPTPDAAPAPVAKSTKETETMPTETETELAAAVAKSTEPAPEPTDPEPTEPADVVKGAEQVLTINIAGLDEAAISDAIRQAVAKAKGDPMVAVFDADGNLVGTAKPGDITPITDAGKSSDVPSGDDAPTDLTPAPADVAGVPADASAAVVPAAAPAAVVKSVDDESTPVPATELEQLVAKAVQEAREKDQAVLDEQAEVIKGLTAKVEAFGEAEATPKVLTNGAAVPDLVARRHAMGAPARSASDEATQQGRVMKAQLAASTDATEQAAIVETANAAAMAELRRIQAGR